ncbi:MAG: VWA domain-containing protein [Chloroflexota bacterium]|nr:VWA domain-containing protein [Chloroflexota bacterium]
MSKQSVKITSRWDRPAVATGKGETWLVVTIETGKRKGSTTRQPVDVSFVIDRSGSMTGMPLELARRGVHEALGLLDDRDTFSVVAYDHTIHEYAPRQSASRTAVDRVRRSLAEMMPGGSTDLFGGWQHGVRTLQQGIAAGPERRVTRTILLTDGQANVGLVDPAGISHHVSAARRIGVTTSTLGLGEGFDEELLTGMAEAGGGNFAYAHHAGELPAFFARELGEALSVVASEASLTLTMPKGVRARLLNPFPTDLKGKALTVTLGDLPAGLSLDLVFSVTTREKKEGPLPALDLAARWVDLAKNTEARERVAIDPLMVIGPADFATMPRDEVASRAAAEMIAADAKRQAIANLRRGNRVGARDALLHAQTFAAAAPSARMGLVSEISDLMDVDPSSPDFARLQRQIVNNEHRRSRGRDL